MLKLDKQIRVVGNGDSRRAVLANPIRQRAIGAKAKETSSIYGGNMFGAGRNSMVMDVLPQGGVLWDTMLGNLIGDSELPNMRFYRDIYHYDPVAGSMVDLMSTMPFSDYTLVGSTKERIKVFEQAIEQLNLKAIFPEISIDYMVTGAHVSTLMYSSEKHRFVDMMPWRNEDCTIDLTPMACTDPIIHVNPSREYQHLISSADGYKILKKNGMNNNQLEALRNNNIELDPLTTLWIPRKTFSTDMRGTSAFKRILPIYLIEKTLYRGTLVEAGRRQRALLHVAIGDDTWEPTPEEMQAVTSLFMQADLDPLGPVIATRQGITPSEMRCLAGDTLISTEQGLKRIDELVEGDFTKQTSVPVKFKVKGLDGTFKPVSEWHYQGKKPTIEITTRHGSKITCTKNHKFLVLGENGELDLVPAYKLNSDSMLCLEKNDVPEYGKTATHSNLLEVVQARFNFDSIVEIKDAGIQKTYDLSMSDTKLPLFIANGIVTKNSGGDFWKYTDIIDTTNSLKMKALGVSEAFLSSDAAYGAMDVSLSVFVENLRTYRDALTYKVFTSKIFPLIAAINKYYKEDKDRAVNPSELADLRLNSQQILNDTTRFDIPAVHWRKALRPEADTQYLEVLGSMKDKGVPIPLSMIAMSGGLNMDALIQGLEEDKENQRRIEAILGPQTEGEENQLASTLRHALKMQARSPMSREFSTEYMTETPTGKPRYVYRQKIARDKAYDALAKAVRSLAAEGEHGIERCLKQVRERLGRIPSIG